MRSTPVTVLLLWLPVAVLAAACTPGAHGPPDEGAGGFACPSDFAEFEEPILEYEDGEPLRPEPTEHQLSIVTRLPREANAGLSYAKTYWLTGDERMRLEIAVSLGASFAVESSDARITVMVDGKQVSSALDGTAAVVHVRPVVREVGFAANLEPSLVDIPDGAHLVVIVIEISDGIRLYRYSDTYEIRKNSTQYCRLAVEDKGTTVPHDPASWSVEFMEPMDPSATPLSGRYSVRLTYAPEVTALERTRLIFFGLVNGEQVPITRDAPQGSATVASGQGAVVDLEIPANRPGRFTLYVIERWGESMQLGDYTKSPTAPHTWRSLDFDIPE